MVIDSDSDIYSTIRGGCDGCHEKYCESRNHHELAELALLALFLCRNPNKHRSPNLK